jgi:hypothetical protein
MTKEYYLETFDDRIPSEIRAEVWDYLQTQDWHIWWQRSLTYEGKLVWWCPADDGPYAYKVKPDQGAETLRQPRITFASDEYSLRKHQPIHKLWMAISEMLGHQYVIEGYPEDMYDETPPPKTLNQELEQGWRVYVSGQPNEDLKYSHTVHRDSIVMNSDEYFTLLYVANPVWYPTWMAECVYYPDDETTGDTQQYQKTHGQSRGFPVGWASKIVSPVPGRVILYDGRWLHTTRPAARWCPEMRNVVAFRLRKVKP